MTAKDLKTLKTAHRVLKRLAKPPEDAAGVMFAGSAMYVESVFRMFIKEWGKPKQ